MINGPTHWPEVNTDDTPTPLTAFETQEFNGTNSCSTPVIGSKLGAISQKPSMMGHATPTSKVSAFCRAAISALVPLEFWGSGEDQSHNKSIIHRNVDRFIKLRRFENLSLHEVSQGLKASSNCSKNVHRYQLLILQP